MTHDELLAKVDEQIAIWSSGEYGWPRQWLSDEVKSKIPMASYFKALRAVVELTPAIHTLGPELYREGWNNAMKAVFQAIEEQLK